ncbi:MAG: C40 family peptidase [Clostridiales bacterium]|nr:C40 family peptidase [Candidatus Crickella caballi]
MNIKNHLKKVLAVLLCMAVVMTSVAFVSPTAFAEDESTPTTEISQTTKLLNYAYKQKGKKYKYGGFGPNSFDCIGFVYYVYSHSGAKLKTSMTKKKAYNLKKNFGKYIVSSNIKKAQAGDIIAYYKGGKTKHAVIAIGNGKCISAKTKGGVKISKLTGRSGCKAAVIRIV